MNKKSLLKINIHKSRILFAFIILCCAVSNTLYANNNKPLSIQEQIKQKTVTINVKNVSVKVILDEIQKQSGFSFIFKNQGDIKTLNNLSLEVKNTSVDKALNILFSNTDFTYSIIGETVSIHKRVTSNKKNENLKISISGRVLDEDKQPISGATLIVVGSTAGAISDGNGAFSLTSKKGDKVEITFVGMLPTLFTINNDDKNLIVIMKKDAMVVDDVVVTGIYTRTKESFTGSASTFKTAELKNVGGMNVLQSLKSLDPSFNIMESREFGSDPNRLPDIEIRGKSSVIGLKEQYGTDPNQPLFILDGFETSLKTIVDLNMDRVASVTILKDAASTAIYGSKAANGVVVVETKSPEKGKFRVTYSGNMYVSMPDLSDYNLMNSEEKLQFEFEAGRYTSKNSNAGNQLFLDSLYNLNKAELARGVDTYWMNEPLRTSITHKHNIYAEGGDDIVRYGVGINYNSTAGVMKVSGNDLIGTYFDLSYRKGNFLLSNKMSFDYYTQEDPTVAFSEYSKSNPYYRKTTADGGIGRYLADYIDYNNNKTQYTVENPLYNATLNSFSDSRKMNFEDKLSAEYKILPKLVLRGRFGIGASTNKSDRFTSPQDPSYDRVKYDIKGMYVSGISEDFYYDGDATLSYGQLIKKHQINAVLGARMRSSQSTSESNTAVGFPIGDFIRPSFSTGYRENSKPSYSRSESRSNSVYFNGGYSYNNKYLIDANFRLDGSSIFGSNKKHSQTWAVGLAWNLQNEKFMEKVKFLDRAKFRASVGNPGNQNFNAYQSFTTYVFNNEMRNAFGASMIIDKYGNPDLKWQKTLDKNIGFDISMLKNKVNITFDYFNKKTDPLLASISIPSSVGVTSVFTNMGEQRNKGYSGTIKVSPILRPQDRINWTLSLNFRHQTAEYRNIGNSLDQFNKNNKNSSLVRYYDGGNPSSLWAVRSFGINPSNGQEVFLKKDGSYTYEYDIRDEVIVGNSEPNLEGVLGSTFYYKGFSFSLYFRYSLGADVFTRATYNKVENISYDQLKYNQDRRALYERWRKPGDIANFKAISLDETTPISSRFVLRENYIKAESISVGYDFNAQSLKSIGIESIRLQGNMNDLFRISSIKEERGIEYPFARSFSLSLSLTF